MSTNRMNLFEKDNLEISEQLKARNTTLEEKFTIEELIGKTLKAVDTYKEDTIIMKDILGYTYTFRHRQDCCEEVYIEDICGSLENLIGVPLIMAEKVYSEYDGKYPLNTWTFISSQPLRDL